MTRDELRERQAWTYEQKIDHSLYVIDTFIHRTEGKCTMVLDTNAESAVLLDLTWRIERSISGVYPCKWRQHEKEYKDYPLFPDMANSEAGERKYLERGQCATYIEDGDKATEAYPLSIWLKADIERYISEHRDLKKFIRNRKTLNE